MMSTKKINTEKGKGSIFFQTFSGDFNDFKIKNKVTSMYDKYFQSFTGVFHIFQEINLNPKNDKYFPALTAVT